jgi:hypothetical protein
VGGVKVFDESKIMTLRSPCAKEGCGNTRGRIVEKGAQDCVYCCACGRFQYNAPRTETGKAVRSVSTVHKAITPKKRARILERANTHCELCGKSGTLHVGHLISVEAGMAQGLEDKEINSEENLCAMCDECNLGIGKQPVPLKMAVAMVMARLRRAAE